MPQAPCPTHASLAAYALGGLTEAEWTLIEQHLAESCPNCERVLSELERTPDPIHGLLRRHPPPFLRGQAGEPVSNPAANPSRRLAGRYELEKEIGRGGMGIVYQARDLELSRTVAVKVISGTAATLAVLRTRFAQEARSLARLNHPSIVGLYDFGEDDGRPYIVLEFVDGQPLDQLLHRQSLSPGEAAKQCEGLARAVQYAHEQGVIHRDLKPANILIAADGTLKIADFGLAKQTGADGNQTRTGVVMGTASYMSPEQAFGRAREVTHAADIYSLGATLYEMLTGRPPYQGETAADVLDQVRRGEPLPPTRLRPKLPRDLETICLKCLDKEPRKRYSSASKLAEDLRAFLEQRPIEARPVSRIERAWRWCRRNPLVAALVSAVALSLATGAAVAAYFAVQAAGRAEVAEELADEKDRLLVNERELNRRTRWDAANLLFEQAHAKCLQGDAGRGVLELALSLGRAESAGAVDLEGSIRTQLAAWTSWLQPLTAVLSHQESFGPVVFSSDWKTVVTTSAHAVRAWDAETGKPAGPILKHAGQVQGVAFSPDNKVIVSGSWDKTARLWEMNTGRSLVPPMRHEGKVETVAFSPDGKTILTGSADKSARVWEVATGQPLGAPFLHPDAVTTVAFHPDQKTVVTGTEDGAVRVWEVESGTMTGRSFHHGRRVTALAVSPNGDTLVSGSADGTALLWNLKTGKPIGFPLYHQRTVYAVQFSPDGTTVLTGSGDGTARLWEAHSGKPLGSSWQHRNTVRFVSFSPDGKKVLTVSHDRTARIWQVEEGLLTGKPLPHAGAVCAAAFDPAGDTILTGSHDRTARLWDVRTGKQIGQQLLHQGIVKAVAFSPDGKTVLTGSYDKTGQLWNVRSGNPLGAPLRHDSVVGVVGFSPDGRFAMTGSLDGTARLWDARTGTPMSPPLQPQGAALPR